MHIAKCPICNVDLDLLFGMEVTIKISDMSGEDYPAIHLEEEAFMKYSIVLNNILAASMWEKVVFIPMRYHNSPLQYFL
jgi:hypothetical protein